MHNLFVDTRLEIYCSRSTQPINTTLTPPSQEFTTLDIFTTFYFVINLIFSLSILPPGSLQVNSPLPPSRGSAFRGFQSELSKRWDAELPTIVLAYNNLK